MKERLTSELHTDGRWHARYPTGTQTLCGLEVNAARQLGRRREPTCGHCSRVARVFERIDGSMPRFWKVDTEEEDDGAA